MYWWSIKKLKDSLRGGPLPQPESFKYLLANTLLTSAALTPGGTFNTWDWIGYLVVLMIGGLGVYYSYRRNGGRKGSDLLGRYFSISWVMFVRALVMFIPVFVLVGAISDPARTGPLETASVAIWGGWYFWRVGHHMGQVAEAAEPSIPDPVLMSHPV